MLCRLIVLFLVVSHGISLTKSQEGGHIVNNKTQTSTLDQIFTSDSDIIKQITSGPPLRGSDHLTATLEVKLYDNVEYLASKKFNWAKCDVPRLISTARHIDWSYSEEALHCVDIMCSELESKIIHAIQFKQRYPEEI